MFESQVFFPFRVHFFLLSLIFWITFFFPLVVEKFKLIALIRWGQSTTTPYNRILINSFFPLQFYIYKPKYSFPPKMIVVSCKYQVARMHNLLQIVLGLDCSVGWNPREFSSSCRVLISCSPITKVSHTFFKDFRAYAKIFWDERPKKKKKNFALKKK